MWFQPVVDTAGHRIVGQECLIRDALGPDNISMDRNGIEILDCARASCRLEEFDAHATRLAIRSAASQKKERGLKGPWFVNFFPSLIADPGEFINDILDLLLETCMLPGDFVFEVVESDIAGDSARLRNVHDRLRSRGFGFSLDNAGVGNNSFQMIRDYRPDYVKIDQRFTWHAERPSCASTIRKLVAWADLNGTVPIGTGVERTRMIENLWLLGVQVMQGYLLGRPSPVISHPAVTSDLISLATVLSCEVDTAPAFADLHQ